MSLATGGPSTGGGNEFDDLEDYGFDDPNDPFSDNYVVPGAKEREKAALDKDKGKDNDGLGITEAIEVTKKPRAPRVKLDENRYECRHIS
jgi:replication fork protection complex subunit Csm3/Swi3